MELCPCGTGKNFSQCCKPLLSGEQKADTPEQLMRSRYSAFATRNLDYVIETTDPQVRMEVDPAATRQWMHSADFFKLEVKAASMDGNKGFVEFTAWFRDAEGEHQHHEKSKFRKQNGQWFYRPR